MSNHLNEIYKALRDGLDSNDSSYKNNCLMIILDNIYYLFDELKESNFPAEELQDILKSRYLELIECLVVEHTEIEQSQENDNDKVESNKKSN